MSNQSSVWTVQLRQQIKDFMHRDSLNEDDLNFILDEDLRAAWKHTINNESSILGLLRRDIPFFKDMDDAVFYEDWIRLVSTFVYIRDQNWSTRLQDHARVQWSRSLINSPHTSTRFRDGDLPFTREELSQYIFSQQTSQNDTIKAFYKAQFVFIPVVLKKDQLMELEDKNYRLPLVEEGRANEAGSYGLVTKVKIACRHYSHPSSYNNAPQLNTEAFTAARKAFDTGYFFAHELRNLNILRSSELQHSRIMQSFASIIIGTQYNLFFPWADLDLDRFLNGEYPQDPQIHSITPCSLMGEALKLLGALDFLHESIRYNGERVIFCHHDLKPDNILITFERAASQSYPLGEWKIADFGISTVESRRAGLGTTGDVFVRIKTRNTNPGSSTNHDRFRYPGPYQPPEVEPQIAAIHPNRDGSIYGQNSDIWSFGCIILCVLVFAVGGPEYTKHLQQKAREGGVDSDGVPRAGWFYRRLDQGSYGLNPYIREWIEGLVRLQAGWMAGIWNVVVGKMLCLNPQARKPANEIYNNLERYVGAGQAPRTNIWTHNLEASHNSHMTISTQPQSESHTTTFQSPSHLTSSRIPGSTHSRRIPRRPVPTSTSGNAAGSSMSPVVERTETFSRPSHRHAVSDPEYLHVIQSGTPSSEQSGSEASRPTTGSMSAGISANLEASKEDYVSVTADGSSILYLNEQRAKIFLAVTNHNGQIYFTNDEVRSFDSRGGRKWDEAHVCGQFVALRRTAGKREDNGEIQVEELLRRRSSRAVRTSSETTWTGMVENRIVNGMDISAVGHVVFRFFRSISLFNQRGEALNLISAEAQEHLSDGVRSVAFDATGKYLVVVSTNHWLFKDLEHNTAALVGRHAFSRSEHGRYKPFIFPFTNELGFMIHDIEDPGRCVLMLPIATQSNPAQPAPRRESHVTHREDHFNLEAIPAALVITPDNARLVYVAIVSHRMRSSYEYVVRSRVISTGDQLPVAEREVKHGAIFEKESKKQKISIAATLADNNGYVVLAALANGKVRSVLIT